MTRAIERAQLRPGDRLPSVREVVRQITINPNTVHRAYRELEHFGLAEGRSGLGTFITEANGAGPVVYRSRSWRDLIHEGIEVARSEHVSDERIIEGIRDSLGSDTEVRL